MKEKICEILGISTASYYRWKEDRKIIKMLEKYFTEEELDEFIKTEKISKLEKNSRDDINLEIFFADNAIFKIIESIENFSLGELREIENLKNIDISTEEAEEIKAMDLIIEWIKRSKTADEFIEISKKHNYTFLTILLNPLEIDGMIKNKQYTIEKINKILKRRKKEEMIVNFDDDLKMEDDNSDYEDYDDYMDRDERH